MVGSKEANFERRSRVAKGDGDGGWTMAVLAMAAMSSSVFFVAFDTLGTRRGGIQTPPGAERRTIEKQKTPFFTLYHGVKITICPPLAFAVLLL